MYVEDIRTTLVYRLVAFGFKDGSLICDLDTDIIKELGIRFEAPLRAAAARGLEIGNAFLWDGV